MVETPETREETVRFTAPVEWRCGYFAWLPREAPRDPEPLDEAMRRGILLIRKGPVRKAALEMLEEGGLTCLQLPVRDEADVVERMRVTNPPDATPFRVPGRMLDVVAFGRLEPALVPLWASMAAGAGLARAFDGALIEPACLREMHPRMLRLKIPARPRLAVGEHVMVLSSSDEAGRGRMTTLGLARLGAPEISVVDVPEDALIGLASIVNALLSHVYDETVSAPVVDGRREVVLRRELIPQPSWRETAFGRCGEHVPRLQRGTVRLTFREDAGGFGWLDVDPPQAWDRGREAWVHDLLRRWRLPRLPPLPPACGHAPRRGAAEPETEPGGWDA